MSEQTNEPEFTAGQRIEQFLSAVDKALVEGAMGNDERQNILADLRVQIEEMLAARTSAKGTEVTGAVTAADVEAVLAELDPPESYLEAGSPREGAKTEEVSHGCGGRHWHRGGPRWFWRKRRVAEAVRRALHSFGPFGHPMFGGFTSRARDAVALAKSEAQRLRHDFIGTEHLLLGLIQEGTGMAAMALAELGVTIERARDEVARLVPAGPVGAVKAYLPLTPRLRQAMDEARLEARKLGHDFIGTEHLLLGLLHVPGVAGQVLTNSGLTAEKVREEVLRQIGSPTRAAESRSTVGGSVTYWPASAAQRYKIGANEFRVVAGSSDTDGAYCAIEMAVSGADGLGMRAHGREDVSIHVIEGNVRLRVQDRVIEMSTGDFCRVPRATMHEFQPGERPAKLMLIATPAGVEKFFAAAAQAVGEETIRQIANQHGVTLE